MNDIYSTDSNTTKAKKLLSAINEKQERLQEIWDFVSILTQNQIQADTEIDRLKKKVFSLELAVEALIVEKRRKTAKKRKGKRK